MQKGSQALATGILNKLKGGDANSETMPGTGSEMTPKVTQKRNLKQQSPVKTDPSKKKGEPWFPSKADLRGAVADPIQRIGDGKVHIYLLPYCKNMEPYGPPFREGPGLCCRMFCAGKPSPLFDFRKKMGEFVASINEEGNIVNFPKSIEELEELYKYKFVYSNGDDQDKTGLMKRNAIACYINNEHQIVQDFLLLIDDFMHWRAKNDDGGMALTIPEIIVHNHTGDDITPDETIDLQCPFTVVTGGTDDGIKITDVPPPVYPKRFVIMRILSEKPTHVDITIYGNCKPFASRMAFKNIPAKSLKLDDNDVYYEKFYTLHDYEIGNVSKEDFILKSVLKEIFEESPIVLQVAGGTFHGAASDFLDKIKALKNVFY